MRYLLSSSNITLIYYRGLYLLPFNHIFISFILIKISSKMQVKLLLITKFIKQLIGNILRNILININMKILLWLQHKNMFKILLNIFKVHKSFWIKQKLIILNLFVML
jgi:hypothetical protein